MVKKSDLNKKQRKNQRKNKVLIVVKMKRKEKAKLRLMNLRNNFKEEKKLNLVIDIKLSKID